MSDLKLIRFTTDEKKLTTFMSDLWVVLSFAESLDKVARTKLASKEDVAPKLKTIGLKWRRNTWNCKDMLTILWWATHYCVVADKKLLKLLSWYPRLSIVKMYNFIYRSYDIYRSCFLYRV